MWRFGWLLVGMVVVASPAFGQSSVWGVGTCKPQSAIENFLKKQYREEAVAGGVTNGGGFFELWVSKEGTWTVVLRRVSGVMCLMGAGEGWRNYPKELEGEVL